MKSSRRDLFIDMVVDRFIFKTNQITLSPCLNFIKQEVWHYLKHVLVFTVNNNGFDTAKAEIFHR